ncbi:MAG: hypothetical protein QM308_02240 [Bacillota bacterium]|nr:hypothetical protein [Bacillota bacterium]
MSSAKRDRSLDIFKGLLVIMMTCCHVSQFFGDHDAHPLLNSLETAANVLVFPGFVLAFGAAAQLAYYRKPFKKALPGMLRMVARSLAAFYLSGIAFRVIREGKPFGASAVQRILLLQDLPGWSEFLAAFAVIGVLSILLYAPVKATQGRPWLLIPAGLVCLLMCFLPYQSIRHPLLRLLAGTTAYACFPALQYLPYFLIGVYYARGGKSKWSLPALLFLMTALGLLRWRQLGYLPTRFPPDIGWVLLPAVGLGLLLALSRVFDRFQVKRFPSLAPRFVLSSLGRNSLFYLLCGNLAIFALAGRKAAPRLRARGWGLFSYSISTPLGVLLWTLALLLAIAFMAGLVRRDKISSAAPIEAETRMKAEQGLTQGDGMFKMALDINQKGENIE